MQPLRPHPLLVGIENVCYAYRGVHSLGCRRFFADALVLYLSSLCSCPVQFFAFRQNAPNRGFLRNPFPKIRGRHHIYFRTLLLANRTAMIVAKLYGEYFTENIWEKQTDHTVNLRISRNASFPSRPVRRIYMPKHNYRIVRGKLETWSYSPEFLQYRSQTFLQIFHRIVVLLRDK